LLLIPAKLTTKLLNPLENNKTMYTADHRHRQANNAGSFATAILKTARQDSFLLAGKSLLVLLHWTLSMLLLFFITSTGMGQTATYHLLFNASEMVKMEYEQPLLKAGFVCYSVKPTETEQFIFKLADKPVFKASFPQEVATTGDLAGNKDLATQVNTHKQAMFLVRSNQKGGYQCYPVIEITHVERKGAFYYLTAAAYSFTFDTTRMKKETNLAQRNQRSRVFMTEIATLYCLNEYHFDRNSTQAGVEHAQLRFIPGVGITAEASGGNDEEIAQNEVLLRKIDNLEPDAYYSGICHEKADLTTLSGNPMPTTSKEPVPVAPTQPRTPEPLPPAKRPVFEGLADCPTPPGRGYHIVQPGDNLKAIARTYRVATSDLLRWNNLTNADKIDVCQQIFVTDPKTPGKTTPPVNHPEGKKVVHQELYWKMTLPATEPPEILAVAAQKTQPTPEKPVPALPRTERVEPENTDALPYTVRAGDNLARIARAVGCPEYNIRIDNNLPVEGPVTLKPGQVLQIKDCQQVKTPTPKIAADLTPQPSVKPIAPKASTEPTPDLQPRLVETTTPAVKPLEPAKAPLPKAELAEPSVKKASLSEHVVIAGETVNSIAHHYRVSAFELAQINGISTTRPLAPGTRLQIPRRN
jgi:LysM repeat protein